MTVALKIRHLLEKGHVNYDVLEHNLAYTSSEIAQAQHLPGHQVVKSVIVNGDGRWIICVLSSTHKIDFEKLRKALSLQEVTLADEVKIAALYPGCEVGAMPPFGQLAGIDVCVDTNLLENDSIAFNAGTHTELIKIKFKDFMRLENPTLADFSVHI
ncbi:MAG TPA: YbaK/EbsC family protein [Parachlamydiaceae bacterium]|nr:YbaK/EbsC family protein [Parachlamydiaceae bacterium]